MSVVALFSIFLIAFPRRTILAARSAGGRLQAAGARNDPFGRRDYLAARARSRSATKAVCSGVANPRRSILTENRRTGKGNASSTSVVIRQRIWWRPTRPWSPLGLSFHCGAATLALKCGALRDAETADRRRRLRRSPAEIAEEVGDLLEQVYFGSKNGRRRLTST
jgi:hypothetical protein